MQSPYSTRHEMRDDLPDINKHRDLPHREHERSKIRNASDIDQCVQNTRGQNHNAGKKSCAISCTGYVGNPDNGCVNRQIICEILVGPNRTAAPRGDPSERGVTVAEDPSDATRC